MSESVLRFDNVTRRFGSKTALDQLNLVLAPGEILGLVGSNGAGKTTALRLALGILHADRGTVRTLGMDPVVSALAVRRKVSILAEESNLYPYMTVQEILSFGAALHPNWDPELSRSLSQKLGLEPGRRIQDLSRGTKAKVALVLAAACRPQLLLLDDPTAGLDPVVRREVLQSLLETVAHEGGSVIYASHLIHDLERVANRVAALDRGRLILDESLEALKGTVRRVTAVFENQAPEMHGFADALSTRRDGRVLSLVVRGRNGELARTAAEMGARDVRIEPMSLEDILVACLNPDVRNEVRND